MGGFLADAFAIPSNIFGFLSNIMGQITQIMDLTFFFQIIMMIIILAKCIFSAFNFFIQFIMWVFKDFIEWFFMGDLDAWGRIGKPERSDKKIKACFLCWFIRYIIVIAYQIMRLPKCFIWYFLDTAGWVIYLPFRLVFSLIDWLLNIGIVRMEHKSWDFMDEIDYFIHGKPKDNYFMYQYSPSDPNIDGNGNPIGPDGIDPATLGMGFHIIHFPDSVMYQCYSISPFGLAEFPDFPMDALEEFIACASSPF